VFGRSSAIIGDTLPLIYYLEERKMKKTKNLFKIITLCLGTLTLAQAQSTPPLYEVSYKTSTNKKIQTLTAIKSATHYTYTIKHTMANNANLKLVVMDEDSRYVIYTNPKRAYKLKDGKYNKVALSSIGIVNTDNQTVVTLKKETINDLDTIQRIIAIPIEKNKELYEQRVDKIDYEVKDGDTTPPDGEGTPNTIQDITAHNEDYFSYYTIKHSMKGDNTIKFVISDSNSRYVIYPYENRVYTLQNGSYKKVTQGITFGNSAKGTTVSINRSTIPDLSDTQRLIAIPIIDNKEVYSKKVDKTITLQEGEVTPPPGGGGSYSNKVTDIQATKENHTLRYTITHSVDPKEKIKFVIQDSDQRVVIYTNPVALYQLKDGKYKRVNNAVTISNTKGKTTLTVDTNKIKGLENKQRVIAMAVVHNKELYDQRVDKKIEIGGGVPPPVDTPLHFTSKQKKIADQYISIFENSTTTIRYNYAENIHDLRGITAGRAGFTSATGDMLMVIELYTKRVKNNTLKIYISELRRLEKLRYEEQDKKGSASTRNLKGLKEAWRKEAKNAEFRKAQDEISEKLYFYPALQRARELGLKYPLSLLSFYDTIIQHGKNGFETIVDKTIKATGGKTPKEGANESLWLRNFNKERKKILLDPANKPWDESVARVDELVDLMNEENYQLSAFVMSMIEEGNEVRYTLPDYNLDIKPPSITLAGESIIHLLVGDAYDEPGAASQDDRDGEIEVTIAGLVDTDRAGEYTLYYTADDFAGNRAVVARHIIVSIGDNGENNSPSLSKYDFIDEGYGIMSPPLSPSLSLQNPYVPDLSRLGSYEKIYVSPSGKGDGKTEVSPASLEYVIKNIRLEKKVIVALAGKYKIKKPMYIRYLKDVVLISKKRHGAKLISDFGLDGNTDKALFIFASSRKKGAVEIDGFSIIGFESYPEYRNFYPIYKGEEIGRRVKKDGTLVTREDAIATNKHFRQFIFHGGGAYYDNDEKIWVKDYSVVKNIYLSDMDIHHYTLAIYSGANSFDWTIDKSRYHHGNGSYLWYMEGWHHSVINSVMYDGDFYSLSLRGYGKQKNVDKLAEGDWSTLIAYNTFGSNSIANRAKRSKYHIGIYSEEKDTSYMPQNILITNNVFVDTGVDNKSAIGINLSGKRDLGTRQKLIGLKVVSNYSDKSTVVGIKNKENLGSYTHDSNVLSESVEDIFFVSDTERNYRIKKGSSLRNSGSGEGWIPTVDMMGTRRDNADVGAYEVR